VRLNFSCLPATKVLWDCILFKHSPYKKFLFDHFRVFNFYCCGTSCMSKLQNVYILFSLYTINPFPFLAIVKIVSIILQYGYQCYCGHDYYNITATNCNMPCRGNGLQICGSGWVNSVYSGKWKASTANLMLFVHFGAR